jgi:hypothetical protein
MRGFLRAIAEWLKTYESVAIWLEGIALVLILALDWREYRKQGADRIEQHKESNLQMAIMQSHADATRENATAAKDGAEAAKANAEAARLNAEAAKDMLELIISKERARVRVELKTLNLSVGGFLTITVDYTVRLYGSTEARIVESGVEACLHNSPDPTGTMSSYLMPMGLEQVLTPQSPVVDKVAFLTPLMKPEKADVDRINEKKSFVHFRGFIKYKDVFERERETRFQYLWNVTDLQNFATKGPFSYWMKCGAASDNMET